MIHTVLYHTNFSDKEWLFLKEYTEQFWIFLEFND